MKLKQCKEKKKKFLDIKFVGWWSDLPLIFVELQEAIRSAREQCNEASFVQLNTMQ
jgi:hypothetical protein